MAVQTLSMALSQESNILRMDTFEKWQDHMSRRFAEVQISSDQPADFHALICDRNFDDVLVSRFMVDAHQQVDRLKKFIIEDECRYFKLSMILSGTGIIMQDGREAHLGPGDLAIYDTSRPYTAIFNKADSVVMIFDQDALRIPKNLMRQFTATKMSSVSATGRVIGPFLRQLATNLSGINGNVGNLLAHNTLDLINTLVYAELMERNRDSGSSLDDLTMIKKYVDRNLGAARMDLTAIAEANFTSLRRVQYLFAQEGETVTSWIRTRRLERCRQDLLDPALTPLTITQIASRWGFADSAHFSRAFKSTFGVSPSHFRQQALYRVPAQQVS